MNLTLPASSLGSRFQVSPESTGVFSVHLESVSVRHNRLRVEGWAFSAGGTLLSIQASQIQPSRQVLENLQMDRDDVATAHPGLPSALQSGFHIAWTPPIMMRDLTLRLEFSDGACAILTATPKLRQQLIRRTVVNLLYHHPESLKPLKRQVRDAVAAAFGRRVPASESGGTGILPGNLYHPLRKADIILPVYGRMDYIQKLLPKLCADPHVGQLIIIDDASPDPLLQRYLEHQASLFPFINLIRNSANLGFVASANIGFRHCRRDAILLNSDVDVPEGWIPRLLEPLQRYPKVATVTPFTNAGTILSFPRIALDNHQLDHLGVTALDRWFRLLPLPAAPISLPTGVGFCMAVSRTALERVGEFDEKAFGKGYGEENDWCLRASRAGFQHVAATNLYVHHEHGGSFAPRQRETLIREHLEILNQRYPAYHDSVQDFLKSDPLRPFREMAAILIATHESASRVRLWIDHHRGGGAQHYREAEVRKSNDPSALDLVLSWSDESERFEIRYAHPSAPRQIAEFSAPDFESFFSAVESLRIDEVHVNNLVFFQDSGRVLEWISGYLRRNPQVKSVYHLHDYHPICPSHNLINKDGVFCGVPSPEQCRECLLRNRHVVRLETGDRDIIQWRREWKMLFDEIGSIRTFSPESGRLLQETFPETRYKIAYASHEQLYHPAPLPLRHFSGDLVAGVFGNINTAKGAQVINRLAHETEVPVVVAGKLDPSVSRGPSLKVLGPYQLGELRALVLKQGITVGFVPSIWPETFNFVTDELIALGLPVVCFDVGAHAARVRRYEKGHVLDLAMAQEPQEIERALRRALEAASSSVAGPISPQAVQHAS